MFSIAQSLLNEVRRPTLMAGTIFRCKKQHPFLPLLPHRRSLFPCWT